MLDSAMKERPIMFSGPMIRAILDGSKSQTRRVVKPQPIDGDTICKRGMDRGWIVGRMRDSENAWRDLRCPYGDVGEQLWVREALRLTTDGQPVYEADGGLVRVFRKIPDDAAPFVNQFRPAMLMPRWASRITLVLTDVRAQRLHDINESDADAEGVLVMDGLIDEVRLYARAKEMNMCATDSSVWFAELWDSINAKNAPWASNPYVWAITFVRATSEMISVNDDPSVDAK